MTKEEKVQKLLESFMPKKATQKSMRIILRHMFKQMMGPFAVDEKLYNLLPQEKRQQFKTEYESMIESVVARYADEHIRRFSEAALERFTEGEIDEITKFYSSVAGSKWTTFSRGMMMKMTMEDEGDGNMYSLVQDEIQKFANRIEEIFGPTDFGPFDAGESWKNE